MSEYNVISNPRHYTEGRNFQPIDIIEDWKLPFHLACVVKYIARHKHKGNPIEDLKKAQWYLDRYIELYEYEEVKEVFDDCDNIEIISLTD